MLNGNGLGFEYWLRTGDWLGEHCLFVDYDGDLSDDVRDRFERVEVISDPRLKSLGHDVALCYGYRGPEMKASPR